jgi:hypothetical protein
MGGKRVLWIALGVALALLAVGLVVFLVVGVGGESAPTISTGPG